MKTKLIKAEFDRETGVSTVIIQNKYGRFTGQAKLHPDDFASKFKGCTYAEERAIIKSLKKQISLLEIKIKTLKACYNSIESSCYFNPESYEAKAILKQIYTLQKNKKNIKEEIRIRLESLEKDFKEYEIVTKKWKKIQNKGNAN